MEIKIISGNHPDGHITQTIHSEEVIEFILLTEGGMVEGPSIRLDLGNYCKMEMNFTDTEATKLAMILTAITGMEVL